MRLTRKLKAKVASRALGIGLQRRSQVSLCVDVAVCLSLYLCGFLAVMLDCVETHKPAGADTWYCVWFVALASTHLLIYSSRKLVANDYNKLAERHNAAAPRERNKWAVRDWEAIRKKVCSTLSILLTTTADYSFDSFSGLLRPRNQQVHAMFSFLVDYRPTVCLFIHASFWL